MNGAGARFWIETGMCRFTLNIDSVSCNAFSCSFVRFIDTMEGSMTKQRSTIFIQSLDITSGMCAADFFIAIDENNRCQRLSRARA